MTFFSKRNSLLISVVNFSQGAPTNSNLIIKFSSVAIGDDKSGYVSIVVNGEELIKNLEISSTTPIYQMWDIAEYLQGGDNYIIFKNEMPESKFAIYSISLENEGVGVGNFYKLSKKF